MKYRFFILILVLFLAIILSSCTIGHDTMKYYGEYPQYFTIAVYNLLGISGSERDMIKVLDQDEYGRTLFSYYTEHSIIDGVEGLYSVMICQRSDERNTYYYPLDCFEVAHKSLDISDVVIEELKAKNNWGEELDSSKMVSSAITRSKEKRNNGGSKEQRIFKEKNLIDDSIEYVQLTSLARDDQYRWLFYVKIVDGKWNYKRSYLLILNKDNSYKDSYIELIPDVWNYQDQLKKFMTKNEWTISTE